ncbi:unnamed protein product [Parnassius apollo]|uniref:(apollo) hypothetical protein n=1 Tax=Parnassius apollo TaxID=110799 RepID=A0A8S3WG44_PARAO|nr:unnamed protein product [Parnassius apollo]
MVYRTTAIIALQLILIQNAFSQCINRVLPNCGQNIIPEVVINTPTTAPLILDRPLELAPVIIQDSSVANSLANALQLLVVSNLLSNTLPNPCCEVLAPAFTPVEIAPNYVPIEVIGGNGAIMAPNFFKLLLIELLVNKVMSSYLQQAQQYFQVPGQSYYQISGTPPTQAVSHPYKPSVPTSYQPSVSSTYMDYSSYPTLTSPYTVAENFQSYKIPVPNSAQPPKIPSSPLVSKPTNSPKITHSGYDSNVLNNLAIALQLLILNNLLNTPISEQVLIPNPFSTHQKTKNEYESVQTINPVAAYYETSSSYSNNYLNSHVPVSQSYSTHAQPTEYRAYFETNPYDQTTLSQYSLPNANYLGSNNLGGLLGSFGVPPATTRPGLNLKSPYDAIASAPFSENTSSSPFEYTKNDFQSPYSAILAADNNKDLFSIDF